MKTRFKYLIAVAFATAGSLFIAGRLSDSEDAPSSRGKASNGLESKSSRNEKTSEKPFAHRSERTIQKLSVIDNILNKYQNLPGKYIGEELENRRLDLIGLESRALHGFEICDLIDRVSDEFGSSEMIRLAQIAINALDSAVDEQERVLNWFVDNPNPAFKAELILEAAKMYAVSDSKNPIPMFTKIKEPRLKDGFSAGFVRAYAREHGIVYPKLLVFSSDSKASPELTRAILECSEIREPESIRGSLEEGLNVFSSDVAGALLSKWVDIDSGDAVRYILGTMSEGMDSAISNALALSPNIANDLVATWTESGESLTDLDRVVRRFSRTDPVSTWESLTLLPESEVSASLKLSVYEEWSRIDEEKANDAWNNSVIENH